MKVLIMRIFEADVEDLDPNSVDVEGLAKDSAFQEMAEDLHHGALSAEDFEYITDSELKAELSAVVDRRLKSVEEKSDESK